MLSVDGLDDGCGPPSPRPEHPTGTTTDARPGLPITLAADIPVGEPRRPKAVRAHRQRRHDLGDRRARLVVVVLLRWAWRRQVSRPKPGRPPGRVRARHPGGDESGRGHHRAGRPFGRPLAVTLFVFIFVCNLSSSSVSAATRVARPPTGDINLTFAMGAVRDHPGAPRVVCTRGIGGYVRHYAASRSPVVLLPVNLFINIVEEIAKPITLALRLFGNLLSGGLMLTLIAALGAWNCRGPSATSSSCSSTRSGSFRPLHRGDPGVHLRPPHDPVLRRRDERCPLPRTVSCSAEPRPISTRNQQKRRH